MNAREETAARGRKSEREEEEKRDAVRDAAMASKSKSQNLPADRVAAGDSPETPRGEGGGRGCLPIKKEHHRHRPIKRENQIPRIALEDSRCMDRMAERVEHLQHTTLR